VFNGEIFNYLELRAELERRGHRFYTQSDTEVIVHLYEEYGDDFPTHLNGQFAIALWDAPRRRLLLVRDRPGILPLYFRREGGRLLFGSEVKALLPAMAERPELDRAALNQLMTFWAPVSPASMFRGVEEVRPGEMLIVEGGGLRRQRYWEWTFPTDGDYLDGSVDELAEELHALLLDATRLRLRADVPVGAYLSGGLDSSGISAMVHHLGHPDLRTFSIRFEDPAVDESAHQERMSRHLGTQHTSILCRNADIAAVFPHVIARTEAPVLRTAPAPMSILSGLVRQNGYKVVLTGEGADEALGGYDLFKEAKIRQFWARQPDSRWRPLLLKRLYPYLDISRRQQRLSEELLWPGAGAAGGDGLFTPAALEHDGQDARVPERGFPGLGPRGPDGGPGGDLAGGLQSLASLQPRAVSRGQDADGRVPAEQPGRPDADGELGGGPLPVPRPPRDRIRQPPAPAAEDARPEREIPAEARAFPAPAGGDRAALQATLPGAGHRSLLWGGRGRRSMCGNVSAPDALDAAGYFDSPAGAAPAAQDRARPRDRFQGQHGLSCHIVDPVVAS
jgi:hypothetical protein